MDYSYLLNKYTIDYDKLLSYGFIHKKNVYTYKCNLSNNMYLVVSITNKTMHTNVFDSLLMKNIYYINLSQQVGLY